MKKFCESLREQSYQNSKICYISKEKFENEFAKDQKYCKVKGECHYIRDYRGAAHSICNLT